MWSGRNHLTTALTSHTTQFCRRHVTLCCARQKILSQHNKHHTDTVAQSTEQLFQERQKYANLLNFRSRARRKNELLCHYCGILQYVFVPHNNTAKRNVRAHTKTINKQTVHAKLRMRAFSKNTRRPPIRGAVKRLTHLD